MRTIFIIIAFTCSCLWAVTPVSTELQQVLNQYEFTYNSAQNDGDYSLLQGYTAVKTAEWLWENNLYYRATGTDSLRYYARNIIRDEISARYLSKVGDVALHVSGEFFPQEDTNIHQFGLAGTFRRENTLGLGADWDLAWQKWQFTGQTWYHNRTFTRKDEVGYTPAQVTIHEETVNDADYRGEAELAYEIAKLYPYVKVNTYQDLNDGEGLDSYEYSAGLKTDTKLGRNYRIKGFAGFGATDDGFSEHYYHEYQVRLQGQYHLNWQAWLASGGRFIWQDDSEEADGGVYATEWYQEATLQYTFFVNKYNRVARVLAGVLYNPYDYKVMRVAAAWPLGNFLASSEYRLYTGIDQGRSRMLMLNGEYRLWQNRLGLGAGWQMENMKREADYDSWKVYINLAY